MTDQNAAEVLNDLIQVNARRIACYEEMIEAVNPSDKELRFLYAKLIGESYQNKINLATELQALGEHIDLSADKRGHVYRVAMRYLERVRTGSRIQILDQTDACEDAVIRAYDAAIHSEDLANYLRDLLIEHQAKINFAREKIRLLKMPSGDENAGLPTPP